MPSSVIQSLRYEPEAKDLTIVFQSGHVYVYRGVPIAIVDAMRQAFSKGEYFLTHIRDKFPFERVYNI